MFAIAWDLRFLLDIRFDLTNKETIVLGLLERVDVSFPYNLIHACMFAIAWDLMFILDIRFDFTNKGTIVPQETSQRDED